MSYIYPVMPLLAATAGLWYYKKLTFLRERLFIAFLWYTVVSETAFIILDHFFMYKASWLYDIYSVVSFSFYFYWYYNVLTRILFRKITIGFAMLFLTLTLLAYGFPEQLGNKGYAFITGAISVLVLSSLHFYELLNSDEVLEVRFKLSFWVSTALLLFYIGIIPLVLLANYMDIKDLSNTIILISLNCILYGCYIIGFIWMRKKFNRS